MAKQIALDKIVLTIYFSFYYHSVLSLPSQDSTDTSYFQELYSQSQSGEDKKDWNIETTTFPNDIIVHRNIIQDNIQNDDNVKEGDESTTTLDPFHDGDDNNKRDNATHNENAENTFNESQTNETLSLPEKKRIRRRFPDHNNKMPRKKILGSMPVTYIEPQNTHSLERDLDENAFLKQLLHLLKYNEQMYLDNLIKEVAKEEPKILEHFIPSNLNDECLKCPGYALAQHNQQNSFLEKKKHQRCQHKCQLHNLQFRKKLHLLQEMCSKLNEIENVNQNWNRNRKLNENRNWNLNQKENQHWYANRHKICSNRNLMQQLYRKQQLHHKTYQPQMREILFKNPNHHHRNKNLQQKHFQQPQQLKQQLLRKQQAEHLFLPNKNFADSVIFNQRPTKATSSLNRGKNCKNAKNHQNDIPYDSDEVDNNKDELDDYHHHAYLPPNNQKEILDDSLEDSLEDIQLEPILKLIRQQI